MFPVTSSRARTAMSAAALALILGLSGCKSVTGRIWLPVYAQTESAAGRVTVHFTADCDAAGSDEATIQFRYVDTVADVRFDGLAFAPLCSPFDSFYGMYGEYTGFYYPDEDLSTPGRQREGTFWLQIVDGGRPGYSEGDYVCFGFNDGAFQRYKLRARHDFDGDGFRDEGCAYIGGGVIQLNLDSTVR
jgi:hypothetical protein